MADFACTPVRVRRQCDITREANALARRARVCEQCSAPFHEKGRSSKQIREGSKQRFCSIKCAGVAHGDLTRVYATKKDSKRAERARAHARAGLPPPWAHQDRTCTGCQSVFVARSQKSLQCEPCRTARKPRLVTLCLDCNNQIVGTAAKRRCVGCHKRRQRRLFVEKHGNVKNHRRRARRYGVAYEPINPIGVFNRDSWLCQMCGVKTLKRLRGSCADRAPELDHRIPMALGGSHTWDNVQCSCRACNIQKGSKRAYGQINLFPRH